MDSKESNKVSVDSKITVGRLINTSIAVNFVCVMIAALVVVGTMAHLHSDLKSELVSNSNGTRIANFTNNGTRVSHFCILYSSCSGSNKPCDFKLGTTYACGFCIYTSVIIMCVGIIFICVAVVRIIFASDLSITAAIELAVLVFTLLLSFLVGVVLSIGIYDTCSAMEKFTNDGSCPTTVPLLNNFKYYGFLNSAQAAIWFTFLFLVIALLIYIIRTVIFLRRRQKFVHVQGEDDSSKPLRSDDSLEPKAI